MFERFTDPARRAVVLAQEEARDLDHHYLGTEHLLLGVLRDGSGAPARALQRLGIEVADVRSDLVRIVGRGSPAERWEEDADALRTIGIDLDEVRRRVEETFGPRALERRASRSGRRRTRDCASTPLGALAAGRIPLTPRAKKVLALALREATALQQASIGPEHLLLAILREGEGLAMQILTARGASPARLRAALAADLSGPGDVPGRPA